jgi:hypothetical protein
VSSIASKFSLLRKIDNDGFSIRGGGDLPALRVIRGFLATSSLH